MSVNAYIKEQIAYQERIRELERACGQNYVRATAAEGREEQLEVDNEKLGMELDDSLACVEELIAENKRLREAFKRIQKMVPWDRPLLMVEQDEVVQLLQDALEGE